MFDPKTLLAQVLGSQGAVARGGQQVRGRLDQMSGSSGFAGGAAMGGVLGLLLGNKKMRKGAGGLLGYGGAAVVGAMALQAYQNYQRNQTQASPMDLQQMQAMPAQALPHAQPAADGSPFELVLVQAMVAAAKADGHMDAQEQQRVFGEVERLQLEPDAKAYVFDLLTQPVDLEALGRAVVTQEQAAEVYLAARLAIDPDQAAERVFLDALAARLRLPTELRAQLEAQIAAQSV